MTLEEASETAEMVIDSRSTPRPSALIVGPMKAGTSWLHQYLKTRPDVALPAGVKETFFFDDRFDSKTTEWYLSHFAEATSCDLKSILEVAPTYFHPAEVPGRVLRTLGEIKVVVTLREPAARAYSLFQHMRRYGFTQCTDFRDAVHTHPQILASSHYATCLQRWRSTFAEENVSVLFMQDLATDPLRFATDCCLALGLDPPRSIDVLPDRVNVASEPRNYYLARAARLTGDVLRSARLYAVVEAAKQCGLKTVFFGKPQRRRQAITPQEREWFLNLIADDLSKLSTLR